MDKSQLNLPGKDVRLPLAGINFFLADVRDGLGPFLAIYLIATLNWNTGNVGLVMTIAGVMMLLLQIPAGAIIDSSKYKRTILVACCILVAFAMICIQLFPHFYSIAISKAIVGAAGAFFVPAIAGITLGTVGTHYYAKQVASNETFNHAGNVFAAIAAALLGYYYSLDALFWFTAVMAVAASGFTLMLNKNRIDNDVARGFTEKKHDKPESFIVLFEDKTLVLFGISILLFHLANAAMLLMVGEEVAVKQSGQNSVVFVAGSIISAQFIMLLMAILVKKKVDNWGRKSLFLIGFIALPIRGFLFTLSSDPYFLLAVQLLDGVGAGLFGALFPIVTADLTRGSGRYNLALGTLSMLQGIGAAASTLISGYVAQYYGFYSAFGLLACIAVVALLLFYFAVPETKEFNTA
jgi:MFS family permease